MKPSVTKVLTHRLFVNGPKEREVYQWRVENGHSAHIRPYSTLVAAMGDHWHPGCREAVEAMVQYSADQGQAVGFYEERDRCFRPYDAMGVMRNAAYMRAIADGYEFILYVDNDVLPPKDALHSLSQRFAPIINPIVLYADGENHGLLMPQLPRGQGLVLVTSCVLSFLLVKTAVFLPWATVPFWQDAIGADDQYHFMRFGMAGHLPFVDTDVTVTCVSPPHYPLDAMLDKRKVADLESWRGGNVIYDGVWL